MNTAHVKGKAQCIREFQLLVRMGSPGLVELARISSTLFSFHEIVTMDEQAQILVECGLEPVPKTFPVTFKTIPRSPRYHFEDQLPNTSDEEPRSEPKPKKKKRSSSKKSTGVTTATISNAEPLEKETNPQESQDLLLDPPLLVLPSPASTASVLPPPPPLQEESVRA